jgi:3-oxoacyl-[acyl-carrier protein] reductase
MHRFKGQVAVITGGADGLGKAIAHRIAKEGGSVAIIDINASKLSATVDEFILQGLMVSGYQADVTSEASFIEALDQIVALYAQLEILVHCAGIVGPTNTSITEYPVDAFDLIYAVNLRGSFIATKSALKYMKPRNYGRILLMASIAGKEGNPFMVGYSATKAGVIGLVKGVAKEYAETGITINGMAPAVIKTAFNDNTAPEQLAYMTSKIPMKRLGTVEEVAALATWIVSNESTFTTGFIFDISGGRATS